MKSIPDGYRVKSIATLPEYKDKLIITNAEDYKSTKVEVRTDANAKENSADSCRFYGQLESKN